MADTAKTAQAAAPKPEVPTATYEVWFPVHHNRIHYKRGDLISLPVAAAANLVANGVLVAPGTVAIREILVPAAGVPVTGISESIVPVIPVVG